MSGSHMYPILLMQDKAGGVRPVLPQIAGGLAPLVVLGSGKAANRCEALKVPPCSSNLTKPLNPELYMLRESII